MAEVAKLYIGDEFNLELLHEEDVIDGEFLVLNADSTAFDFTGFTDVYLVLFDTDTRSKEVERLIMTTNLTIPTPTNGIIVINIDYSVDIDIEPGLYYGKLTYLDATSRVQSPGIGVINIRR